MDGEGALKGLGDGDGREVLATSVGRGAKPLLAPPGEKRDGTVPARARLVEGWFSGVGRCEKSGKPSVGDSGMFSRRGVELPLVGGPQTLTGRPSWACISRALQRRLGCAAALGEGGSSYLLENNLLALPNSCDGDPAPDRALLAILPAEFKPPDKPKGDLNALPLEGSVGDVFAVEDPERGRLTAGVGRYPSVRCSDLADDIIDYSSTKCPSYLAREMAGRCLRMYVLRPQPNPDVGGQINDCVRRTRREQFRISRVDGREGRNCAIRFWVGHGGVDAVKECGGRGEKENFDESFEFIKKRLKGAAPARSMAGRQAEGRRSLF